MFPFSLPGSEPRASWHAPVLSASLICAAGASTSVWLLLDALPAAAIVQLLSLLSYLCIAACLYFAWRLVPPAELHFQEFPGALPVPLEEILAPEELRAEALPPELHTELQDEADAFGPAELAGKRITARHAVRRRMRMH